MFKNFVVSKEDLQLARSHGIFDQTDFGSILDMHSQQSPRLTSSKSQAPKAGSHNGPATDEQEQGNSSAPPLSPSIDDSDDNPSPTSSFTFAGMYGKHTWKSCKKLNELAKHAQHGHEIKTCLLFCRFMLVLLSFAQFCGISCLLFDCMRVVTQ